MLSLKHAKDQAVNQLEAVRADLAGKLRGAEQKVRARGPLAAWCCALPSQGFWPLAKSLALLRRGLEAAERCRAGCCLAARLRARPEAVR
jgi:hypothetical protein